METIHEPSRETDVVDRCDVLVVGGGPAGVTAAVAAAREGRDTLLVERYGMLGGMATGGLVIAWPGFFPDGPHCYGGLAQRMFEDARRRHDVTFARHGPDNSAAYFSAEVLKQVFLATADEADVRFRLHSWAVGVHVEAGRVRSVILESKEGRQAIMAKVVVDATGDMDAAQLAGVPTMIGHMHQMGLRDISHAFRMCNVDTARFGKARTDRESGYVAALDEMEETVDCRPWLHGHLPDPKSIWTMAVDFMEADCLKVADLTRVEMEGRKQIRRMVEILKRSMPGFEDAFLAETAPQVGVRLSRQIVGEYTFMEQDGLGGRRFPDAIGCGDTCSDKTTFDIPYRALVPQKVDGLIAAGRGISAETPRGAHLVRPIPHCLVTGEAAGCAAALALEAGLEVRDIDVTQLQRRLAAHDVNIRPSC